MNVLILLTALLLGVALGWAARQYRVHDWARHGWARMRGGQWYPDRQVCPGCLRRRHVLRVDDLTGLRRCPGCCGRGGAPGAPWSPWEPRKGSGQVTGGAESPEGAASIVARWSNDNTKGDEK